MTAKPLLLAMLASLLMAGCASVGPDYQPPEVSTPATWQRLGTVGAPAPPADLAEWWRQLGDPQLDHLIDQALAASPDLAAARARLAQARALRELAGADRFPTVTASISRSRSRGSREIGSGTPRDLYSAGFDASWEPDVFGGQARGLEAAQADLEASAASLGHTRVSLVAEVALNYVELRAFQIRQAVARANLASQAETFQLTEWRAQAGLTTALDVEQARANLAQTTALLPTLATGEAQAQHRLAVLTGQAPGALIERLAGTDARPFPPPGRPKAESAPLGGSDGTADARGHTKPPPGCPKVGSAPSAGSDDTGPWGASIAVGIPADTLRQRPDVAAAERSLAAATARVGEAQAARYPSFNFSGSLGLEALSAGALGSGGALARSLVAGIKAPVFDAGRLARQVDAREAARQEAEANWRQTVLTALEEVENALVALANNRQRGSALGTAREAADTAAQLARQRYAAGLIDFQTVLDTERSLLSVEDSLATTRAEEATALIQLYKALGGGWSAGALPEERRP